MKSLEAWPMEADDLNELRDWLCDEEVHKNLYDLYYPMSIEELEEWFDREKSDGAHLFKYIDSKDHVIGMGLLHHIHTKNMCGELSLIINPPVMGKGYGTKILDHVVRYGFHILNLRKLFLHAAEFNKRMVTLAENRGFALEGTFRKEIYYAGNYYDIYRFGMMHDEYERNLVDLA
jgi:RimJ/RimL family protein N-acetyltransferase